MKIRVYQSLSSLIVAATATLVIAYSQQPRKDSGAEDMNNISDMSTKEMNKRGDHVMGFDHMKTTSLSLAGDLCFSTVSD